jgi:hypothetical protein
VMDDVLTVDAQFRAAVAAIDEGDVIALERLLKSHPSLVTDRLESLAPGFVTRSGTRSRVSSRGPSCSGSWPKTRSVGVPWLPTLSPLPG